MIRPFTFLCFLLAGASGLYLYQSKHRVQVLDQQIEQTVHQTEAAREQVRLLNAEWMLLNDPDRLRQLATQFLSLHTVTPNQFTTMAELDSRLPPVAIPAAPAPTLAAPQAETPVAEAAPPAAPAPAPAAAPAIAAATAPAPGSAQIAERKVEAAPLVAERRPAPPVQRPAPVQVAQRSPIFPVNAPRARPHAPLAMPVAAVSPLQGGSALGMAQHGSLPPPRPISLFPPLDGH